MLYIFRYFKEIQKSIFVIRMMFETFLFGSCCTKVCEELSYVLLIFLPFLFCAIVKWPSRPAIPKQSCRFALVFSTYTCGFRFSHTCLCVVSLPDEANMLALSDVLWFT